MECRPSINPSPQPERLHALTSLRFVAAMIVVFRHTTESAGFGWQFIPKFFIFNFGVSFFFILSGFILTHIYCHKRVPFAEFIRNRWVRLWPAHVLWLVVMMVLLPYDWWTYGGTGLFNRWVILGFNIPMLQSIVPVYEYFFSWNAVSWSISTAFFLYLAFYPLLTNLHATWHWKLISAFVLFVLLSMTRTLPFFDGLNLFSTFPPARVFEFCLGMSAYLLWHKMRNLNFAIIFLILFIAIMVIVKLVHLDLVSLEQASAARVHMNILFRTLGVLALACLIIAAAHNESLPWRLLDNRVFVYLGELSYSLYLCHQIFIRMFISHGPDSYWASLSHGWQAIIYFPLILVSSMLSYHLVETPLRKILRNVNFKKLVSAGH